MHPVAGSMPATPAGPVAPGNREPPSPASLKRGDDDGGGNPRGPFPLLPSGSAGAFSLPYPYRPSPLHHRPFPFVPVLLHIPVPFPSSPCDSHREPREGRTFPELGTACPALSLPSLSLFPSLLFLPVPRTAPPFPVHVTLPQEPLFRFPHRSLYIFPVLEGSWGKGKPMGSGSRWGGWDAYGQTM